MGRGLRVSDADGNKSTLTTSVWTVISSGVVAMPSGLNGDNSYGVDIDLPGSSAIPFEDISVLVMPRNFKWVITNKSHTLSGYTQNIGYMNSAKTYYKHSGAGVMTSWAAGNLTVKTPGTYDHIASIYPVAFWDHFNNTTFTKIRLFAGTCYLVYDSSAAEYIRVFSIYTDGVPEVDYSIAMKKYNGG
jgi:hypothetical protein